MPIADQHRSWHGFREACEDPLLFSPKTQENGEETVKLEEAFSMSIIGVIQAPKTSKLGGIEWFCLIQVNSNRFEACTKPLCLTIPEIDWHMSVCSKPVVRDGSTLIQTIEDFLRYKKKSLETNFMYFVGF